MPRMLAMSSEREDRACSTMDQETQVDGRKSGRDGLLYGASQIASPAVIHPSATVSTVSTVPGWNAFRMLTTRD